MKNKSNKGQLLTAADRSKNVQRRAWLLVSCPSYEKHHVFFQIFLESRGGGGGGGSGGRIGSRLQSLLPDDYGSDDTMAALKFSEEFTNRCV